MIDLETVVLFIEPPLPGVEASNRAVGEAGREVVGAIACCEVPMDEVGVMPPGARDEDGVEAIRVATVSEGANFGEEASGNLVGEEAGVVLGFRR